MGSTHAGRRMLTLLLALAIVILAWLIFIFPFVMVKAPVSATIHIPRNATEQTVTDSLTKYFGPGFTKKVMMAMRFRNPDFSTRHGAYEIEKGTMAFNVMRKLATGGQTPVKITINNERSLPYLTSQISSKLDFPADSLNVLLADSSYLAKYDLTPENAMALFIDDTYEVYWTASAREVLDKIGHNYTYFWDKARKAKAARLRLTPAEMMTLASIVDEETNESVEKGKIGRLYVNRLVYGMPLQADPTIRFAVGDFTIRRVLKKHLEVESPYNTYKHKGLPPGPIRTTTKQTLNSILDSEPHNYIYMCADESLSGLHNFATNYQEHLENARRYQNALNARGIQ